MFARSERSERCMPGRGLTKAASTHSSSHMPEEASTLCEDRGDGHCGTTPGNYRHPSAVSVTHIMADTTPGGCLISACGANQAKHSSRLLHIVKTPKHHQTTPSSCWHRSTTLHNVAPNPIWSQSTFMGMCRGQASLQHGPPVANAPALARWRRAYSVPDLPAVC